VAFVIVLMLVACNLIGSYSLNDGGDDVIYRASPCLQMNE
jgi:hypothetical protein